MKHCSLIIMTEVPYLYISAAAAQAQQAPYARTLFVSAWWSLNEHDLAIPSFETSSSGAERSELSGWWAV